MNQIQFSNRNIISSLGATAFASGLCFLFLDKLCYQLPSEEQLPGDVVALLDFVGSFGHGNICLLAILLIWNLDRSGRRGIQLVLGSTVLAGAVTSILKVTIHRARPFIPPISPDELGLGSNRGTTIFDNGMQSFPSGHTATAFALATALSVMYPQGKRFFFFLAIMVGLQRVATQSHFPSDVVVGAMIGILSTHAIGTFIQSRNRSSANSLPRVLSTPISEATQRCA